MKRIIATAAVGGLVLCGSALAAGSASAMPSDTPCGASDVRVSIAPDPTHAAGHEAYVLTYKAASPTTNCKLQGPPTAMRFLADGQTIQGVTAVPAPGEGAPVNLRAGKPAESRIVQRSGEAPNPVTPTVVTFDLPTGPYGQPVSVDWPAGAPLKGDTVQLTAVS